MKEWNARAYDVLSTPQQAWGARVLERIDWAKLDREGVAVLDVGAGTGKLTAKIAERLPRASILALDRSTQMIETCEAELRPRFGDRIRFVEGDVLELGETAAFDLVFSTATFHWIADHDRLFEVLGRALKPGGRLEAQCGGAGNVHETWRRSVASLLAVGVARDVAEAPYPALFAPPDATEIRLANAGLVNARAWIEEAPTPFADRATFRGFLESVVFRPQIAEIGPELASRYLDDLVARCEREAGLVLDYVRLNLGADKPT